VKRFALIAALLFTASPAAAWEPQTTQAGLAEQAALASRLHSRLEQLGFHGGLFEPLTIPPADAPALSTALHLLTPSQGAVPDTRGRQPALAWIAAGAALADLPGANSANHFYDPDKGTGWVRPNVGISERARELLGAQQLPAAGMPAPDWVIAKTNPFNLDGFLDQYGKAVSAATPGERSRHMAAALIAAGAMMHVLGDLGSPARVRGDYAAQLDELGGGPADLGSRFERIAELAFGRLGVPAPSHTITRTHLRDYFTSKDGKGLADVISHGYYSEHTLPAPTKVVDHMKPAMARSKPALPARLNLMAASRDDGATLRDRAGTCLARYRAEHDIVSFSLDDDCLLEQVTAILPEVSAYETGLLDFLLRGELGVAVGSEIVISGTGLAGGTVEVLVEDARGVRTSIGALPIGGAGGAELARLPLPKDGGARIFAVYRGADALGEPLVAVGSAPIPQAASAMPVPVPVAPQVAPPTVPTPSLK
jgi:hypothetical protein